ncbi:Sensor histidine kinase [Labilithrix luteola]|uniref:histidine kinase n=1 Tax=Labilithrix luteola TaxID=1391654 RepID=A0A0K1Q9C1_9BACT|nr:Sensor histidine kinase [Labilithrix luteola]
MRAFAIVGTLAMYVALAMVGRLVEPVGDLPLLWPAAGFVMGVAYVWGLEFVSVAFVGATLAGWLGGMSVGGAMALGLVNAAEVAFGCLVLRRLGVRPHLERVRDVMALLACGACASAALSATASVGIFLVSGRIHVSGAMEAWRSWATYEATGIMALAPAVLTLGSKRTKNLRVSRVELFAVWALGLTIGGLVVWAPFPALALVMPILMWVALRLGPRGASVSVVVLVFFGGLVAHAGVDLPTIDAARVHVGLVLVASACLSATTLTLGAAVAEIRRAETDRMRIEAEDRAIRERGELREHLLAIVGHDLRGPLSTVAGAARLLLQNEDPSARRLADVIDRATKRMSLLVEDLLDFARTRLSGISLVLENLDLRDVCERLVEEAKVAHPERAIELTARGDLSGYWDAHRVAQMLANLIGNALTHGQEWMRIEVFGEAPFAVVLRVANGGPPIPAEMLDQLFEPFRRGTRASAPGLGLGLYIVREIAVAHGGEVAATSAEGDGTVFNVVLPRDSREEPVSSSEPAGSLPDLATASSPEIVREYESS